ncbi:hypothetical protein HDV00_000607 [Rhizophlyctis rosea]|nr:hypothetical protein HDV00_000607 [Rhizophlyctis rosea]
METPSARHLVFSIGDLTLHDLRVGAPDWSATAEMERLVRAIMDGLKNVRKPKPFVPLVRSALPAPPDTELSLWVISSPDLDTPAVTAFQQQNPNFEIFLSYCWDNSLSARTRMGKEAAAGIMDPRVLAVVLQHLGFKIWADHENLRGGMHFFGDIAAGIERSSCFIPCLSDEYAISTVCQKELFMASKMNKHILPVVVGRAKGEREFSWKWQKTAVGFVVENALYVDMTVAEDIVMRVVELVGALVGG